MKRILCLIDSLGPGGAQRQLVGLASILKREGYNVKVCVYRNIPFFEPFLLDQQVDYEIVTETDSIFNRFISLYRFLKREKPDCLIAYLESPCLYSCLMKLLGCNFKLIVSERNTSQELNYKERIRFSAFRLADFVVPNSYSQERFIKTHFPKLAPKTYTISNFVDLKKFAFVEHQRRSIPLIVVVASIWPPKNTKGFIKSVSLAKSRGNQFLVSWYGITQKNLDYYQECLDLIKECHLEDCVSLLPKTDNIASVYQQCDYFCLPSFYEGTPNVICEAIATGRPIICSDVCDNGVYVKSGYNGETFNPRDYASIADALTRALSISEERYLSYCRNSRTIAEEQLSEGLFWEKHKQLFSLLK